MKLREFHYDLPKDLIAQKPLKERDMARLMVLGRKEKTIVEKRFCDIIQYLNPGDCLVLNDTRVLPVRLYGRRKTGAKVEIFLLDPLSQKPRALIRPSKRISEGEKIILENGMDITVGGAADVGRFVRFDVRPEELLKSGHVPLPPYIDREDVPEDKDVYQTVYACKDGATASPTAGLHFTKKLIGNLKEKGISIVYVTLHTSYGTFAPVKEENIEEHVMHSEYCELDKNAADIINKTKREGGKIFAVGTTSTRTLESSVATGGEVAPFKGETDLFIYPGFKFQVVDSIITNFHLPESTLLMLISAFSDRDFVFEAYKGAIESRFRFFSYGDAMLIM